MSRVVYKYVWPDAYSPLGRSPAVEYLVELPHPSQVVEVAVQGGSICLWVDHDPAREPIRRRFVLYGTGHEVPDYATHVGTVHMPPLVLHVYEEPTGRR